LLLIIFIILLFILLFLFSNSFSSTTSEIQWLVYMIFAERVDRSLASETKLNRLLQELAWEAVAQHPLSGVRLDAKP